MRIVPMRACGALLCLASAMSLAAGGCAQPRRPVTGAAAVDSAGGGTATDAPDARQGDLSGAGASPADSRTVDVESMRGAGGASRLEELLVGRVAGVSVVSVPGGMLIRVRGVSTIMGVQEPLYVVDGMPVEPGPGGLIALAPGDIATIEVLKDASSTSFYGVRGANGVVLIRTRR